MPAQVSVASRELIEMEGNAIVPALDLSAPVLKERLQRLVFPKHGQRRLVPVDIAKRRQYLAQACTSQVGLQFGQNDRPKQRTDAVDELVVAGSHVLSVTAIARINVSISR